MHHLAIRRAPAHRGRWRFSQLQHGLHPTELDRIREEIPHLWGVVAKGPAGGAERAESGGPGSEKGWVLIELGRKLSCNWSLFQGINLLRICRCFFGFLRSCCILAEMKLEARLSKWWTIINEPSIWKLKPQHIMTGWWLGTFFIFHNIWDNPSHWLIMIFQFG